MKPFSAPSSGRVTCREQLAADDSVETRVTLDSRTLSAAPLGEPNPWPRFCFQVPERPVYIRDDLKPEDRVGMFADAAVAPLPYLMQDGYSRRRKEAALPVVRIENAVLGATIYPSLGGRLISLFDKNAGRELLFDNPVLQFANLAIRNAWFAGGIEWNGPLYGHSLLTCEPVFAGIVDTPRGPLLRLYEFDRALETTWQVDLFLPSGDDRLWVHVRAINPNEKEIPFYWWTNITVPLTPETRVLSPAEYALSHDRSGNSPLDFPVFDGFDGSYPFRYPCFKSVFFRRSGGEKPWSLHVDADGTGLCHVSTPELLGRKVFTWGSGSGGQHWLDFLSEEGKGQYIELQGGVAPSQLQTRPLGAGDSIEWTECVAPFAMEADAAHASDYAAACGSAARVIDDRVPLDALREMDAFLAEQVDVPVGTLLHRGAAWGWLHEKRIGRRIGPGLTFPCEPELEERPWVELLTEGTFSPETLDEPPRSFVVAAGWTAALRESIRSHGTTWLHHLHLGISSLEAERFEEARDSFTSSLALKESAMAHRCLALLSERDGLVDEAWDSCERAWAMIGSEPNLAVELCEFCIRHKRQDEFAAFVASLPEQIAAHERIFLVKAQFALERGDFSAVREFLDREFCTIREGELILSDLWFASHIGEAKAREGRELTAAEKEQLQRDFPPPRRIDFRME